MTDHLYRVMLHPIENRLAMLKWKVTGHSHLTWIVESCNLPEGSRVISVRVPKDQTSSPKVALNVYHFTPGDAYHAFVQDQVNSIMRGARLKQQAENTLANLQRDIPASTVDGYDPSRLPWVNPGDKDNTNVPL